jgi:hypothetical protein
MLDDKEEVTNNTEVEPHKVQIVKILLENKLTA